MKKSFLYLCAFVAMCVSVAGASETPSGVFDNDTIKLSDGVTVGLFASSEYRWRGLNLSPDSPSVGISATYNFKLNNVAGVFVGASTATIDPLVRIRYVDQSIGIDNVSSLRAGVDGSVNSRLDYYGLVSYTRFGQFANSDSFMEDYLGKSEIEQWDVVAGVSYKVSPTVVIGGNVGYTFDYLDDFGTTWFGDVNGRIMVGKGVWIGGLFGWQTDADEIDGYTYYEISMQRDFGGINAKVSYTYVSDNFDVGDVVAPATDDGIRLSVNYMF